MAEEAKNDVGFDFREPLVRAPEVVFAISDFEFIAWVAKVTDRQVVFREHRMDVSL